MASRGSHRACKRCHTGRVDKRAGMQMCRPCRELTLKEQRAERSAARQRRASRAAMSDDKQLAEPDLSPEVIASEIHVGTIAEPKRHAGRPRSGLSQEQRDEIVRLYVTTSESLSDIAATYGIKETYPFYLLKQAGISWRRGDGTPPPSLEPERANGHVQPEIVDDVPEDVVKALERMVKLPEIPARPEPVRAIAPTQPVRTAPSLPEYVETVLPSPEGEQTWQVDYMGSMLVRATSIEQALERARADGHIRNIVGVTLRTR